MYVCSDLRVQGEREGVIQVGNGKYTDFYVHNLCSIKPLRNLF